MTIDEIKRMSEAGIVRVHKLKKGSAYVMVANREQIQEEDMHLSAGYLEGISGSKVAVISVVGDPKTAIAFYKIDRKKEAHHV